MEKYQPLKTSLDSSEPLLDEPHVTDLEENGADKCCTEYKPRYLTLRSFAIHSSLLVFNLILCILFVLWNQSPTAQAAMSSIPLNSFGIPIDPHPFDLSSIYQPDGSVNPDRSQFGGPPRKELSDSWNNLTQYMNIRLQPEELGQFRDDSQIVQLTDGSGAFGTLAVYHGIHCINRLHRYLYQDHYYPDVTEPQDVKLLKHHTEHCIDWLRQYIQCNADLTVIPMYWGTKQALPMSTDIGNHQCADWDSLQDWMQERTFDAFQPGLLTHPVFGDPYAKHKSNKIGLVQGESLLKGAGSDEEH